MFKFRPTALPGFRVGLPEDDQLGFNVANDGSTLPVVPDAPDVSTVDGNYPFAETSPGFITPPAPSPNSVAPLGVPEATALPAAFGPAGALYNADSGLFPTAYGTYVPFAGGPSPQDPLGAKSDRTVTFYAGVGGTPPRFPGPQGPSPNPTAPLASGSLALPAMRESTASENLQPDPQGEGGGLTLARYDASDLPNRTDPAGVASDASQNAPSDDGFQLARSAQARAPQPPTDTSPGEAVVLPAGFEIGQSGMFGAPAPP